MRSFLSQIAVAVLFGASFLTSQADATNAFRHPKSKSKKSKCPKRAQGGGQCDEGESIVDTLMCASGTGGFDSRRKDFDILLALAGVSNVNFTALDEVTLFAPNDGAFHDLAEALNHTSTDYNETAVFIFLAEALEGAGLGTLEEAVTSVLQYHVVLEELKLKDLEKMDVVETALVVNGTPVTFALKKKGKKKKGKVKKLLHNDDNLDDPKIHGSRRDCETSQGRLHVLKDVLIPVQLTD